MYSKPWRHMEVSGQLQARDPLPWKRCPEYQLDRRFGGPHTENPNPILHPAAIPTERTSDQNIIRRMERDDPINPFSFVRKIC
jgi:hypothetical protein